MSIVTRTGDQGETHLFSGERVSKTHSRVEAYGSLDELCSLLGVLRAESKESAYLVTVQQDLFELGALLANPNAKGSMGTALQVLEKELFTLEATLPPLQYFILPGGSHRAALAHLARTVCRRAERQAIQIESLPEGILPYLNRLSDYLFLLARSWNQEEGILELPWKREAR